MRSSLHSAFIAALVAGLVVFLLPRPTNGPLPPDPAHESAYDRVMRTRELRCGYIVIPPELSKDVATGQMSGLVADIMNEIGAQLHLKIVWTEEVGFAAMAAGLEAGRYDAVCFSQYRLAVAAPAMNFTHPLFYTATGVFVRADDQRFDNTLAALNDPAVTIATIDEEMSSIIAREEFPKAKTAAMPALTDFAQMLVMVETGKADVAFLNRPIAERYLAANPDKLRDLAGAAPFRVFSHGLSFGKQEYALGMMLNAAIDQMNEQGVMDRLLSRVDPDRRLFLRVAKPYEVPQ